jgi:hypothetical protein
VPTDYSSQLATLSAANASLTVRMSNAEAELVGMRDMTVTTTPLVSVLLSTNNAVTVDGPYLVGSGGSVWKNDWKAFDTTTGARQPRFWKVGGYCYIDGVVGPGSAASVVGSTVLNLPVAYRPNLGGLSSGYNRHFAAVCSSPAGYTGPGQVVVNAQSGDLTYMYGDGLWFALDQVSYKCS